MKRNNFEPSKYQNPLPPIPRHYLIPSPHHLQINFHLPTLSLLVKQRLALTVRRLGVGNTAEETIAAGIPRPRDREGHDEEDGEDDKGEDPLQGNDLDGELLDSQR